MNQMGTNQMNGSKSMMCGGMNTSMNAMCGTNQMNQMGTNQMNDSKSMMCSGMNTSMNSMNCTNQMNGGQNMGYSGTNTSMNGICGTNQINMNRMCMNMPMNGMGGMNQMNMNGMCMNGMGANGMYMNMPMIAMGQMSPAVQYNQTGATTNRVASGGNQGNAQPEPTKVEGNSLGWYAKSIKVTDWYKYVTGYNETNFAYVFEDKLKVDEGKLYNQNIPTEDKKVENSQKHYITGKFQLESIGDLIKSFECTPNAMSPITNCPLRIYVPGPCTNMQLYFYELGVATLQADPANANCMFQAASNFSCIEAITESSFPDMIDFTTNYYKDLTQGPAASISAGPAAIARVLEPFSKQGSQTSLHQINVLDNLKEYYNIENGYVVNDKTKGAKTFTVAEMNDILNKIKIGYVNGADVVFGGRHKTDMNVLKKPHQINQVFTAAMNLRQGDNGKRNATLQDKEIKARTLLRGAYLGTYLCALKSRSPRLFLTLIGGGSFGNDISWILGEVINAHKMVALSQKNGTLKSVELVMFNVPQCMDGFIRRLNEEKIPYNYIQITLR